MEWGGGRNSVSVTRMKKKDQEVKTNTPLEEAKATQQDPRGPGWKTGGLVLNLMRRCRAPGGRTVN
jgi:hypothetical protein